MNRYHNVHAAPPSVTEMLMDPPRKCRIDYHRVFAWLPVYTENGRVWLRKVWRIDVEGCIAYADTILPIGYHR